MQPLGGGARDGLQLRERAVQHGRRLDLGLHRQQLLRQPRPARVQPLELSLYERGVDVHVSAHRRRAGG
jgi:hypothetical protein